MSKIHHIFKSALMACCMSAGVICASAQDIAPMTITAKADSTTIVMGDRTTVNVEVIKNTHEGTLVNMPEKGQDYNGIEMIDCIADSADLGNGRIQLKYHFTFQAFTPSELLTLPPFVYAAAGDTVKSDILTYKVLPVELSPELGDINDIQSLTVHPDETVVSIRSKWYDYIPDWSIWVVIGLAVIGLIVTLIILYKKNGPAIFVPRKPIPPYEIAINDLNRLKEKKLIEQGRAKEFYTEVTDIWRRYLEGRFGISALEMTSRQILKHLRKNKETHLSAGQMEQLLELSDYVKFAALDPTPDEMYRTYNTIYQFVESTKPQPEDEPEDKARDKRGAVHKKSKTKAKK